MINYHNFQQILNDLQRAYQKIVLMWFPDKVERQLDSAKAKSYRKLTRMIDSDMLESFAADDKDRALKLWTILTESMKIITAFPEESEADLERLKGLYDDYERKYYTDDSEVV